MNYVSLLWYLNCHIAVDWVPLTTFSSRQQALNIRAVLEGCESNTLMWYDLNINYKAPSGKVVSHIIISNVLGNAANEYFVWFEFRLLTYFEFFTSTVSSNFVESINSSIMSGFLFKSVTLRCTGDPLLVTTPDEENQSLHYMMFCFEDYCSTEPIFSVHTEWPRPCLNTLRCELLNLFHYSMIVNKYERYFRFTIKDIGCCLSLFLDDLLCELVPGTVDEVV